LRPLRPLRLGYKKPQGPIRQQRRAYIPVQPACILYTSTCVQDPPILKQVRQPAPWKLNARQFNATPQSPSNHNMRNAALTNHSTVTKPHSPAQMLRVCFCLHAYKSSMLLLHTYKDYAIAA
jgi:hypothetical protein